MVAKVHHNSSSQNEFGCISLFPLQQQAVSRGSNPGPDVKCSNSLPSPYDIVPQSTSHTIPCPASTTVTYLRAAVIQHSA